MPLTPQTIAFTGPGTVGASASLSATGGVSGNPVAFSVDTTSTAGACTLSGTNNATYAAATQVQQSVTVNPAPVAQTITFPALTAKTLAQTPMTASATASSGLAVTFTTTTPKVCTAGGTKIALLRSGICTVVANQAGNSVYNAAPTVARSFLVF